MKKTRSMLIIFGALFLSFSVVGGASAYQDYYKAHPGLGPAPSPGGGGGGGGGIIPITKETT